MHSDALQVSLSADLSGLLPQETPIMIVKKNRLGLSSLLTSLLIRLQENSNVYAKLCVECSCQEQMQASLM